MGFLDGLKAINKLRYPEYVAQVVEVQQRRLGPPRIHLAVYTGNESIWQPPARDWADTAIPRGITIEPGMRVLTQVTSGRQPRILWDREPPPLPPIQFPNIPGGDDPKVMAEHLHYLVSAKALTQEQFESAMLVLQDRARPPS
jgi:hypothetical protein